MLDKAESKATPTTKGVAACDVEPRDLGVFWERYEWVFCGLGPTITLPMLRHEHLMQVGLLLLGKQFGPC